MEDMTRRRFIGGTAALAGAYLLGACGQEQNQISFLAPTESPELQINGAATALSPAVRGEQIQLTPVPPPPKSWQDGAFITKVLLPDGNRSFAYTIDDGPSPYNTDPILRECERLGIFVTFFVVGVNIRAWPEILRRIRDAGHEIGSHSVYHTPYSATPLAGQMQENREIIQQESGLWVVANRTPGLTRGDIILQTARNMGMYELHTSLNQSDYKSPRISSAAIANELAGQIAPGTFSLNHDGGNSRPTGSGWGEIANVALSRGYTCVRATDMINMGIPLPGNVSYLNTNRLEDTYVNNEARLDSTGSQLHGDVCQYDPKAELLKRLADVSLKGAERSRIVEVLADIEEMERAG